MAQVLAQEGGRCDYEILQSKAIEYYESLAGKEANAHDKITEVLEQSRLFKTVQKDHYAWVGFNSRCKGLLVTQTQKPDLETAEATTNTSGQWKPETTERGTDPITFSEVPKSNSSTQTAKRIHASIEIQCSAQMKNKESSATVQMSNKGVGTPQANYCTQSSQTEVLPFKAQYTQTEEMASERSTSNQHTFNASAFEAASLFETASLNSLIDSEAPENVSEIISQFPLLADTANLQLLTGENTELSAMISPKSFDPTAFIAQVMNTSDFEEPAIRMEEEPEGIETTESSLQPLPTAEQQVRSKRPRKKKKHKLRKAKTVRISLDILKSGASVPEFLRIQPPPPATIASCEPAKSGTDLTFYQQLEKQRTPIPADGRFPKKYEFRLKWKHRTVVMQSQTASNSNEPRYWVQVLANALTQLDGKATLNAVINWLTDQFPLEFNASDWRWKQQFKGAITTNRSINKHFKVKVKESDTYYSFSKQSQGKKTDRRTHQLAAPSRRTGQTTRRQATHLPVPDDDSEATTSAPPTPRNIEDPVNNTASVPIASPVSNNPAAPPALPLLVTERDELAGENEEPQAAAPMQASSQAEPPSNVVAGDDSLFCMEVMEVMEDYDSDLDET